MDVVLVQDKNWRRRLQKSLESETGQHIQRCVTSRAIFDAERQRVCNQIFQGGRDQARLALETISYLLISQGTPIQCKVLAIELLDNLVTVDETHCGVLFRNLGLCDLLKALPRSDKMLQAILSLRDIPRAEILLTAAESFLAHWESTTSSAGEQTPLDSARSTKDVMAPPRLEPTLQSEAVQSAPRASKTKHHPPASVPEKFFRRRRKAEAPEPPKTTAIPTAPSRSQRQTESLTAQLKSAEELSRALHDAVAASGTETEALHQMRAELMSMADQLQKAASKAVDDERMADFTRITRVVDEINMALQLLVRAEDEGPGTNEQPPEAAPESTPGFEILEAWPKREPVSDWFSKSSAGAKPDAQLVSMPSANWDAVWGNQEVTPPIGVAKEVVGSSSSKKGSHKSGSNLSSPSSAKGRNAKAFQFYAGQSSISQFEDAAAISMPTPALPDPTGATFVVGNYESKIKRLEGELAHLKDQKGQIQKEAESEHRTLRTKLSEMGDRCERQRQQLETANEEVRRLKHQNDQDSIRLREVEKDAKDCKELWMRENARASSLTVSIAEKEQTIVSLSECEEALKVKLRVAVKRIKQLEFLLSRDASGRGESSASGVHLSDLPMRSNQSDTLESQNASELKRMQNETSPECRETAPTSTETLPRYKESLEQLQIAPARPTKNSDWNGAYIKNTFADKDAENNWIRYRALLKDESGMLFVEKNVLEVGCRIAVDGLKALVRVFYGNLTMGCLDNFCVEFAQELLCPQEKPDDQDCISWQIAPVPNSVLHGQQICQSFVVVASAPFVTQATARVRFLLPDATPCLLSIPIPLLATRFLRPTTLSTSEFFHKWRSTSFILSEVTCVVMILPNLMNPLTSLTEVLKLNDALELHIGLDADPNNLILAGTFPSSMLGSGGWLVLVRCELGSKCFNGRARIAVRSTSANLARAVRATLQRVISAVAS